MNRKEEPEQDQHVGDVYPNSYRQSILLSNDMELEFDVGILVDDIQ